MRKYFIWAVIFALILIYCRDSIMTVLILIPFVLIPIIILLKFVFNISPNDVPNVVTNAVTHPNDKIFNPILKWISLFILYVGVILFSGIWLPILYEIIIYLKYGVFKSISLNDLIVLFLSNHDWRVKYLLNAHEIIKPI